MSIRHVALATVNEDGTPHNTPLFFIYNSDFSKMYWGSHPNSLHSRNIERTGEGSAVLFDSKVVGQGGLYLALKKAHVVSVKELTVALEVHNQARARWKKVPLDVGYYQKLDGQRMYVADIVKIETYDVIRDSDNLITEETRKEISAQELFND